MSAALQDASTLVLLRDGADGLEVLMVERGRHTRFSAGAWVFPGGKVDPADLALADHCSGLDLARCDQRFGETGAGRYYVAALRELFEEVGIWLFDAQRPADWPSLRAALHQQQQPLREVLGARSLDTRPLYYYRFWTTPPGMPRRYRTRFFLARAPQGQEPMPDGREIVAARFVTPAQMLEEYRQGQIQLIFPTVKELEILSGYADVAAATAALRGADDIPETRSRHRIENGRLVEVLLPGEPGYDDLPAW